MYKNDYKKNIEYMPVSNSDGVENMWVLFEYLIYIYK